ncbi:PfkB family carbohydrate kinase [Propionibacteriaceae bacterium Y1923]
MIHTAQALIDAVADVPRLPQRGGNEMATDFSRHPAGAVNTLLAAQRQGATGVHAGAVGTGPNGDLIRHALSEAGISVAGDPVPDVDSGICFVMVEPGGQRTFVTTLGAERDLDLSMLQASNPRPGDVVCVSGYSSLVVESTRVPLLTWLSLLPDGVGVVLDPGAARNPRNPSPRTCTTPCWP